MYKMYNNMNYFIYTIYIGTMFSPAYLKHISPISLQHRYFFDVGRREAESFDVITGHAQTMPSLPAFFELFLGRTQEALGFVVSTKYLFIKIILAGGKLVIGSFNF